MNQIFNANETGPFWQMLLLQILGTRGDKCCGGQQGKTRITVLLAANMDASLKLRPLVIGKIKMLCMGVTVAIFLWHTLGVIDNPQYLQAVSLKSGVEWDSELLSQNCKLCLTDNFTAHHTDVPLSNIEVMFVPPNITSKLQLFDQGIICTFKLIYK